jgi:hypothetical protein
MSRRIYFLLDFLVVAFFELFLAAFFFAMALSPPFVGANLRVAKIKVNVFLRARRFFLDAHFALALIRASTQRARCADFTRAIRARSRVDLHRATTKNSSQRTQRTPGAQR